MMPVAKTPPRLLERLPAVRGRYSEGVALAPITWFRVGGRAEVMFRPTDAHDLAAFLAAKPADVPVTVLGVGSNLLVRDGGVPGVIVRLGRGFAEVAANREIIVAAPAHSTSTSRGWPRMQASPAWNSSPAFPAPSVARCA